MIKRKLTNVIATALSAVIALTFILVLPACKSKALSPTAESFVNLVMRIKTPITLDSAAEIEAGYVLYDFMDEKDKSNKTVKASKATLDGYNGEYEVLKADKDAKDEQAKQAVLIERFEIAVANLPALSKLTSENRTDVDEALAIYEQLNEQSRGVNSVKEAYAALTAAQEKVSGIEREEHLAEITQTATAFIDGVEEIGKITLDSIDAIEDLLYDYESFTDEVKQFEGVAEAKQKLDDALVKYRVLKDDDDVEKLKEYAQKLSPVETNVTLESERDIINAETLYENMSDRAKAVEGVAQDYEVIVAARAQYDQLFAKAEAERIQIFIAAANAVPTDIENVDITWYDVLEAAADAYWSLTYDSQKLPEVEEAFKRWDAAQREFDKHGYQRLPMTDPNILFSGDRPPHIVLQNEENMLKPIRDFYGVSKTAELDGYAIVWLHVYVEGEYQGKVALRFADMGHIVQSAVIVNGLKQLAAENENVVSGANYSFALSFEDKNGEYIPSQQTKVSASKVYTW